MTYQKSKKKKKTNFIEWFVPQEPEMTFQVPVKESYDSL